MSWDPLWKYCDKNKELDYLLSLDLCRGMELPRQKQLAFLYALSNHREDYYQEGFLPKKNGGLRKLMIPQGPLKLVQKNILHHVLEQIPVSSYAYAYCRGRKLSQNGALHQGGKYLLKLDIRDFFENISYLDVYKRAFPAELFPPGLRGLFTSLCCYRNTLPQGAPSSPYISNLVMKEFDQKIGGFCEMHRIVYSRYCDDLAFTGDFRKEIVMDEVARSLFALGMELNRKKTGFYGKGKAHIVTGAVVNEKIQAPKKYRRDLRQECYYFLRFGETKGGGSLSRLLGKVNYVLELNPRDSYFQNMKKQLKEKGM